MPESELDLLDSEEYFADYERRARERRERRVARKQRGSLRRAGVTGRFMSVSWGRALLLSVAVMMLGTVVGLIVLWPSGSRPHSGTGFGSTVAATVDRVSDRPCPGASRTICRELQIEVRGRHSVLTLGPLPAAPSISPGTPIRVSRVPVSRGASPGEEAWQFVDIDRHGSLIVLALVLAVIALVVIRWRGLLAAIGVGLSILLLVKFLVPAILAGESPLLVALVCSLAVMFVTVTLTHGVGPQSLAAALGIGSTLVLTCLLAMVAVHVAHLDGRTDDQSTYLQAINGHISLQGIVLAGILIGALGVLADTAVTQASAVVALRRANTNLGIAELYRSAFHVGRDHLSATIHTLVLAYAGAALPLLLITQATGVGLTEAVSTQDIAQPIVATLIGCIALVCAVPVTTALAATLMVDVPVSALPSVHHHH